MEAIEVFKSIVEDSVDKRQQGTRYEYAVKYFLENDPSWANRFDHVWMWADSPTNGGDKRDYGIDLVAHDVTDDSYWAIQAKCYSKKSLAERDVATFLALGALHKTYSHLMIADTVSDWTANLTKLVTGDDVEKDVVRLSFDDIKDANLDWESFAAGKPAQMRKVYDPLPHQRSAIDGIEEKLSDHERCTVVMACGTGKTLMALRAVEEIVGNGGTVLYLAPSIPLVAQSLREWANQVKGYINPYVICSDATASKAEEAESYGTLLDIPYPATTDAQTVAARFKRSDSALNVVFSTYQSIDRVHEAQELGLPEFDVAICDEAHRTTGVIDGETSFRMIHDADYIHARKRVYMTATPRIFGEDAKKKAMQSSIQVASMDDEKTYGPVAYRLSFGRAVSLGLLSDYKVVVMKISESMVSSTMQRLSAREDLSLEMPDVAKFLGCWKALFDRKHASDAFNPSQAPENAGDSNEKSRTLHHAIAFAASIRASRVLSKEFQSVIDAYLETLADESDEDARNLVDAGRKVRVKVDHVDGTMDAGERKGKLDWLAEDEDEDTCHILSNARCLAEGVDVPALDAVIYLSSRKSRVDIIQSVGRVMRRAAGKSYGYIIIPVFVPSGVDESVALSSSKDYKVVWDVVRALRSHDERLDAVINAGNFGDTAALERIVEVEVLDESRLVDRKPKGRPKPHVGDPEEIPGSGDGQQQIDIDALVDASDIKGLGRAIRAQIVKKCGTKIYWAEWTGRVAQVTRSRCDQIAALVEENAAVAARFKEFLDGIRDSLNDDFSEQQAIEVLAQHEVTRPVFCALFDNEEVVANNPITKGLDRALESLYQAGLPRSTEDRELAEVYASVRDQVRALTTDESRQRLVKEIYNEFFKAAFKSTADSLGIVYTPVEVVDAQLHLVQRALMREFGISLGTQGVHILDGFAGTGTYMCRLIEDRSLISDEDLPYKYRHDLHSNEIVPLAATIMDINIEQSYHARMGGDYTSFPGALLTDTFQMHEEGDTLDDSVFTENTERVIEQRGLPVKIIIGNPPYNVSHTELYPGLKNRIEDTYAKASTATLKNNLYNSYFLAYRWASDRIGDAGIVCFVSGSGWLKGNAGDGVRVSLSKEFSSIYVIDLRGNKEFRRLDKSQLAEEGDNIFGSGSKSPISIVMLVKNPMSKEHGVIRYFDLGKSLILDKKKQRLTRLNAVDPEWTIIEPDEHGDWLDQRDDSFYEFAPMGVQDGPRKLDCGIFKTWSQGVKTNRDDWCYNFRAATVRESMKRTVDTYLSERERWREAGKPEDVKSFLTKDETRIKWTRELYSDISHEKDAEYHDDHIRRSLYRPFCKQWLYMDAQFNNCVYQQPRLFPYEGAENLEICITGPGNNGFSCMMTDLVPCLDMQQKSQCFPLYWYEQRVSKHKVTRDGLQLGLFGGVQESLDLSGEETVETVQWVRHDAVTDIALRIFRETYPDLKITKPDIFFYIYGVLHSEEFRTRFSNNLRKELPRIPLARDFEAFRDAGRKLSTLHTGYEGIPEWAGLKYDGDPENPGRTEKMRWGQALSPETGKKVPDYTVLHVAENLTVKGIPAEAQDYNVNGKSALGWIVDRYQIKTGKNGVLNDPNLYTLDQKSNRRDARYIASLVGKVVRVSMETIAIVRSLPPLDELPQTADWPIEWRR